MILMSKHCISHASPAKSRDQVKAQCHLMTSLIFRSRRGGVCGGLVRPPSQNTRPEGEIVGLKAETHRFASAVSGDRGQAPHLNPLFGRGRRAAAMLFSSNQPPSTYPSSTTLTNTNHHPQLRYPYSPFAPFYPQLPAPPLFTH